MMVIAPNGRPIEFACSKHSERKSFIHWWINEGLPGIIIQVPELRARLRDQTRKSLRIDPDRSAEPVSTTIR